MSRSRYKTSRNISTIVCRFDAILIMTGSKCYRFANELESGIIEVIAPSESFYPNFTELPNSLDDDHERVVWRSKQSLDYAFLMSYAQTKGTFYVQLEDDVQTQNNFVTSMKSEVSVMTKRRPNWVILEFCRLGFIG